MSPTFNLKPLPMYILTCKLNFLTPYNEKHLLPLKWQKNLPTPLLIPSFVPAILIPYPSFSTQSLQFHFSPLCSDSSLNSSTSFSSFRSSISLQHHSLLAFLSSRSRLLITLRNTFDGAGD